MYIICNDDVQFVFSVYIRRTLGNNRLGSYSDWQIISLRWQTYFTALKAAPMTHLLSYPGATHNHHHHIELLNKANSEEIICRPAERQRGVTQYGKNFWSWRTRCLYIQITVKPVNCRWKYVKRVQQGKRYVEIDYVKYVPKVQ